MERTPDRRAARTRRVLHEAMISLILRKGYEAMTIQDIIDKADVGRSTFYAHFTGKEDLLRKGFETLRTELEVARQKAAAARDGHGNEELSFSLALFEHACAHTHIYRVIVGSRGAVVAANEIRRVLSELVRKDLCATTDRGGVPRELLVRFVVGAFETVMMWLLERKPKTTPAEADKLFRSLTIGGIGPTHDRGRNASR
jgi:AcrR family transcriptional regulator